MIVGPLKSGVQRAMGLLGLRLVSSRRRPRVESTWSEDDLDKYQRDYGEESVAARRFYNVGAGDWSHPAWTNVDNPSAWYDAHQQGGDLIGIPWNLFDCQPLPVEDGSAELVYSSHVVEHVDDATDRFKFEEVARILRPGGTFRVTCPDAELAYLAWQRDDRDFFDWIDVYSRPEEMAKSHIGTPMNEASLTQVFLYRIASSISELHADGAGERLSDEEVRQAFDERPLDEAFDYCTRRCPLEIQKRYPGNHLNWFTKDKLVRMLTDAGFSEVYVSGFGQSRVAVLRNLLYFDYRRPNTSLYVEATR